MNEFLFGPKPGLGTYEDCPTWVEVYHRYRMLEGSAVGKTLGSAIVGWAFVQYVAYTINAVDVAYGWDVLVSMFLPSRLQVLAFGLCLAYRVYGGACPIVSLFS
jgi:hypothetical protein